MDVVPGDDVFVEVATMSVAMENGKNVSNTIRDVD